MTGFRLRAAEAKEGSSLLEEVPLAVVPVPRLLAEKAIAPMGPATFLAVGGVEFGEGTATQEDIQAHLEPALKQPAPKQVELTIQYLAAALLLLAIAVALGQWWLGGIT